MDADLIPELVAVPEGEFFMGSDDGEADERPVHPVHVDGFLIGTHPVTNAQYAEFVRTTGHRAPNVDDLPLVARRPQRAAAFHETAARFAWIDSSPPRGREDHPVTLVRWEDAVAYCAWLGERSGRPCRLPTEAEWEKAARGGLVGKRYPWGDRFDRTRVNFLDDPAAREARGTTPCRTYPPNAYGLYDVAGNVWEWVLDWYAPESYLAPDRSNPRGAESGELRVVRGGAWLVADVRMLRCSHRHKVPPDTYSYSIGFRVASPL